MNNEIIDMNGQAISILNIQIYSNWQFVKLWIHELVTFGYRGFRSVKGEKLKKNAKNITFLIDVTNNAKNKT